MLPIPYFHVTVTLPKELRAVIRRRQRLGYGALMNAAAKAIMRRYLQYVLPKGFHKIRYFGLWHPAKRDQRDHLRRVLLLQQRHAPEPDAKAGDDDPGQQQAPSETAPERSRCQHCRKGKLVFIYRLSPIWPGGP